MSDNTQIHHIDTICTMLISSLIARYNNLTNTSPETDI